MFFKRILWFIAVAPLLTGLASFAQVTTLSTIRGTVADQSGAILPNAEVTLFDRATNTIARTLPSAADGSFEILDVRSGNYKLTVTRKGFKTFVADDIQLD